MSTIFTVEIISDPTIISNSSSVQTDILTDIFFNNFMSVFGSDINNPVVSTQATDNLKTFFNSFGVDIQNALDNANAVANVQTISLSSYYRLGDLKTDKSVVQLDMEGNEITSNDYASFSDNKENANNILGSVEKINENDLLIADSINKRAIIVDINDKRIKWEYVSDRNIFDVHYVPYDINILINNVNSVITDTIIENNSYISWVNNSSSNITIYSGDVSNSSFDDSFDINQYGIYFKSDVIHNGESYTNKFDLEGKFGWFSYPVISIGNIIVSKSKLSPLDYFIVTEGDGNESAFTNRIIKVDCYGNIKWTYGEGEIVKPRDARPSLNKRVIISV